MDRIEEIIGYGIKKRIADEGEKAQSAAKDFTRMCDAIANSADQKLKGNITDGYTYEKKKEEAGYLLRQERSLLDYLATTIKKEKEEMKIQWKVRSINATRVDQYQSPSISAELDGYVVSGNFNPIELSDSLQKLLDSGKTAKESKTEQHIQYCKRDVDIAKDYYMRASMTIKNVIFSNPATIVFWMDGTKTVVKCQEGDIYDPEKGLAMAIAKKALGNQGNYCNVFDKWLPEGHEEEFKKAIAESMGRKCKTGSKKAK